MSLPPKWFFGGIERDTGKCFSVVVPDRTRATLQEAILKHILPGSRILSDKWAAYVNIPNIRQGIYSHGAVNHSENFVDPDDASVHTQDVESF